MVDWDLVDRRRAKGWDWDRIAADEKVGFHADDSAGEPGRALRALYYQRRSKTKRRGSDAAVSGGDGEEPSGPPPTSRLATAGFVLVPVFAIWFLLALAFPSPVGTYLSAIPAVLLLLLAGAFVLAYGLLRSTERWNRTARSAVVVGVVLGFAVSGGVGLVAIAQGCPTLSSNLTSEPSSWVRANNPTWQSNGAPVFFFFGSVACPYCSASSWAMVAALERFGTLSGNYYGHSDSNPQDIPNTPEVVLASTTLQSPYVGLHVVESTDDSQVVDPGTPSCIDQAYVSAYDTNGGIPFVVIGGKFIHTGTLVDPLQLRSPPGNPSNPPLTPQEVQAAVDNQSGPIWNAMSPQVYFMEAIIVYLNGGQPASVANDPNVAPLLKQIR